MKVHVYFHGSKCILAISMKVHFTSMEANVQAWKQIYICFLASIEVNVYMEVNVHCFHVYT